MPVLEREEYIEQVYFFRTLRERLIDGLPSQEILARIGEELLSTTKLPLAVSFLHVDMKGIGVDGAGHGADQPLFHAVPGPRRQPGRERHEPVSDGTSPARPGARSQVQIRRAVAAGAFSCFSSRRLSRNRLGYNKGLAGMADDPIYSDDWKDYILTLRTRLGDVDFADLIFVRSEQFVRERRRLNPDFVPKFPSSSARKRERSPVPTAGAIRCTSSRPSSASSGTPRSPAPGGPTSSRPACLCSNNASPSSKTASRSPRATSITTSICPR